ncbi:hypothetical protein LTR36_004072 [Oleoguttula mirabilis]|uniref:DUF7730 domain-containing protein n=1 Tax=Oleoguttula mirabilis TaxID=1507867 RepID=A0AAV9JHP3_9PEZI|nr:hypothetical protein LTR36_004072 [Oleoguttula mirabilis]
MPPRKRTRDERDEVEEPDTAVESNKANNSKSLKMPHPQGFQQWRTTTKLASGGKLAEMSKYDMNVSKFSHTVKIQHSDAFTLRPVTLTEGPLAGRHVLVLDPISVFFRFVDLPAEIRQMVYDLLLREEGHISITTHKQRGMPRLACRKVVETVSVGDKKVGRRVQARFNVLDTLLRISKQVADEAATTFYGNNSFAFDNLSNMEVFLTGMGSQRKHLRYLRLAPDGYTASKARPTFTLLKDAAGLRTFAFDHNTICKRMKEMAADLKALFTYIDSIHRSQKEAGESDVVDVLSIIKIEWDTEKCSQCSVSPTKDGCLRFKGCGFDCDDGAAHCEEALEEARSLVAKSIGRAK